MNPFVNPNNRSVCLPQGCKDLIDVLRHPKHERVIRRLIRLLLFQAWQEGAAKLLICASAGKRTQMKYEVGGSWYDMTPLPSHIRGRIMKEIARMADFSETPFPKIGVCTVDLGDTRSVWRVQITAPDADCLLTRLEEL